MDLIEKMTKYLINHLLKTLPNEFEFFNSFVDKGLLDRLKNVVESDFARVSYTDAIKILEKNNDKFEFKASWGCDLQSEHEKYLAQVVFGKPVFVYNYPKEIKAFYMKQNEDGKTVRAMDVLFPGIGEIIGGSERETDLEKLLKRMDEVGIPKESMEWYLDTRRFGSVPHSGYGLGFERLMLFITGMGNIRDVIAFPRTPKNCEY